MSEVADQVKQVVSRISFVCSELKDTETAFLTVLFHLFLFSKKV